MYHVPTKRRYIPTRIQDFTSQKSSSHRSDQCSFKEKTFEEISSVKCGSNLFAIVMIPEFGLLHKNVYSPNRNMSREFVVVQNYIDIKT
jgi:hypothetical protein